MSLGAKPFRTGGGWSAALQQISPVRRTTVGFGYTLKAFCTKSKPADNYTHGYSQAVTQSHNLRTAEKYAHHVLPLLNNAASVLDVGCGTGSITKGFAKYMQKNGSITAIDVEDEVLKLARENLDGVEGVAVNVRNESVYELPFADNAFDVVHAHQVLQHLTNPVLALKEMKRVCSGFVCVRDVDYQSWNFYPEDTKLDEWKKAYRDVCFRNNANPDGGRYLHRWMAEAGFKEDDVNVEGDVVVYSTPEEKHTWAETWAMRSSETKLAAQIVEYGIGTKQHTEEYARAWRNWAKADHSMMYYVDIHIVAKAT